MDNLGRRYEVGRGVKKDYCEAVRWYRKAAALGNQDSITYLQKLGEAAVALPADLGTASDISGKWLTPDNLVFQFTVRGRGVFGEIQEGWRDRGMVGGKGYFDRVVMDGRLGEGTVTFHTLERFSSPQYTTDAQGKTITSYVDREVKTRYTGTIKADEIEFLSQRDDGRPHHAITVRRMCPG
jgi:hypothetical protein